jgi:hypothetical protein
MVIPYGELIIMLSCEEELFAPKTGRVYTYLPRPADVTFLGKTLKYNKIVVVITV